MPTPTYDLIEEKVLGSASASVTFSSIPGTYKDLVLELIANTTAAAQNRFTVNGDSGSNYSKTQLTGDGSAAASARASNTTSIAYDNVTVTTSTAADIVYFHFMSYANTNVNKTILIRVGNAAYGTEAIVGLWRSTAAITSITLPANGTTWTSGSTFRLWGVSG